MQFFKSKAAAISIAIFLIISMGASMLLLPSADAHTPPYQITTYAKVVVMPNQSSAKDNQPHLCFSR